MCVSAGVSTGPAKGCRGSRNEACGNGTVLVTTIGRGAMSSGKRKREDDWGEPCPVRISTGDGGVDIDMSITWMGVHTCPQNVQISRFHGQITNTPPSPVVRWHKASKTCPNLENCMHGHVAV